MKQYQILRLNNFIAIICYFPNSNSIYFDVAIKIGSRYENINNSGIAHFVEHLCGKNFINSIKFHSWIKHYINDTFIAYTMEDRTNFEFMAHKNDLKQSIKMISKITQGLKLDKETLETEKNIILEELLDYNPHLDFVYYEFFKNFYYKYNSLKFETLGREENIKKFTLKDINKFIKKYYNLNNIILIVAGNVNIKEVKEIINKDFKHLFKFSKTSKREADFESFSYAGDAIYIKNRNITKTFFGYYYPIFNQDATKNVEWEFFVEILNNYLFYKITSKLSIYLVDVAVRTYKEFLNFSIESSFSYEKAEHFYYVLLEELKRFKKNFNQKQFNYFKNRKIIGLDLDKDNLKEAANMLSWYAFMFGHDKILTLSDQQKIIKSMDIQKIYYYFDLLFKEKKGTVVILGRISEAKKQKLKKIWNDWKI